MAFHSPPWLLLCRLVALTAGGGGEPSSVFSGSLISLTKHKIQVKLIEAQGQLSLGRCDVGFDLAKPLRGGCADGTLLAKFQLCQPAIWIFDDDLALLCLGF